MESTQGHSSNKREGKEKGSQKLPPMNLVYIGLNEAALERHSKEIEGKKIVFESALEALSHLQEVFNTEDTAALYKPDAVLCDFHLHEGSAIQLFREFRNNFQLRNLPFIVLAKAFTTEEQETARIAGIDDFFPYTANPRDIYNRISFLKQYKSSLLSLEPDAAFFREYELPPAKRFFDMLFAGSVLLLLAPLLILIAFLIKIESRGPVFYISKRAGRGFQVFKFYKFRTMIANAEDQLPFLMHLNVYNTTEVDPWSKPAKCLHCVLRKEECTEPTVIQERRVCAKNFAIRRRPPAFVKIENDPRVTKIGKILRKTSLDEIPQLFNVLKGDMSVVGNRPLPLYEAEQLTTDEWAKRFMAPAGITGLWQVKSRGNEVLTEVQRKRLDVEYAGWDSVAKDIKIIFKTIPALLDKKNN